MGTSLKSLNSHLDLCMLVFLSYDAKQMKFPMISLNNLNDIHDFPVTQCGVCRLFAFSYNMLISQDQSEEYEEL